jgi:rod shape-determining protein MreC
MAGSSAASPLVSPLTAQIDLITRDRIGCRRVIGEIGTSNILGRRCGGQAKRDLVEMKYVSGSADVQPGQLVYTTGQDGIYPAGTKVGEIVEVRSGSATVPHQIYIRPSAAINSIKEVGVPSLRTAAEGRLRPEASERFEGHKEKSKNRWKI